MADDAQPNFTITVTGESPLDSHTYAQELRDKLLDSAPDLDGIDVRSTKSNTQDPGSLLVLVLGTPFAVEIAKGIAKGIVAFFEKRPSATLDVTLPNGTPLHLRADSKDMAAIVRAMGK